MRSSRFLLLALVMFVITGCENIPFLNKFFGTKTPPKKTYEVQGTVIAEVKGMPVTLEELDARIEDLNRRMDQIGRPEEKIDTRQEKVDYLRNELIRQKALYREALDRGLDRDKDVMLALEIAKTDLLVTKLTQDELARIDVTSQEINKFYDDNKAAFREPDERKFSEILVSSEAESKNILREYYGGADFAALARQNSKSDTAPKGGSLGFIKMDQESIVALNRCDKYIETVVSPTLEVGSISNFRCPDGWYIVKFDENREGKQITLNESWDDIKAYLQLTKVGEFVSKIVEEAQPSIDESKVY